MMTLEIKVNGVMIGLMKIRNKGVPGDEPLLSNDANYLYDIEAYLPDDEDEGYLLHAQVIHSRPEGAIVLVQRAVNQILANKKLATT